MTARSFAASLLGGLLLVVFCGCHQFCLTGDCFGGKGKIPRPAAKGKGCDGEECCRGLLSAFHGCHNGCGEVYWGEWLYDPPDCCDPCCQCHGVWTGPRDDCRRVIIDPLLWLLAIKHKHCRPAWCGALCPYGYNFHEDYYGPHGEAVHPYGDYQCYSSCCGCGCGQAGEQFSEEESVEEIPTPAVSASPREQRQDRVAERPLGFDPQFDPVPGDGTLVR